MPPNDRQTGRDEDHDDTTPEPEPEVGTDEEAQLLPVEAFEFEDSCVASSPYIARRRSCWQRLGGPQPPRPQAIRPFFQSIQQAPIDVVEGFFPHTVHKIVLLAILLLIWAILFIAFLGAQLPLQDSSGRYVMNLDCVDTLWKPRNDCGMGGINCRPFSNSTFAFRCPANCASVQLLNAHAVGPLDVNYRPFVIGDEVFRGDSFICGSAIHAGVISDNKGGCGRLSRLGYYENYPSSKKNGIESISFDSYFPLSFSVKSTRKDFGCSADPRSALLVVSLVSTGLISVLFTSPWHFFPLFVVIFAHVSFASDPPSASYHSITVIPDHISMFAKRLLPALFCATILYFTVVKRTLARLNAQVEKTVLWLGGFWFGALANYTFGWIPLSRLTAHDLEQQPGAKVALAVILIILLFVIAGQIVYFWLEGRLLRYLGLYGLFLLGILFLLCIPGVNLRIHHYIISLLLLPGTSMQTRASLLYQGILLGLFINGIARWDFDSILQTTAALRADGAFDSKTPSILAPVISFSAIGGFSATFSWRQPPNDVDGISVLVNDVERDRAFFGDGWDEEGELLTSFKWERPVGLDLNEYFRFAFIQEGRALDYTKAGTLFGNGTWAVGD